MKRNLACARAEAATEWLTGYDPLDGAGPVGDQAGDPAALFTQPVVIAAFDAGAEWAFDEASKVHRAEQDDWTIERATGQRQLDEAGALMMEAAALFEGYAEHHRNRAEEFERADDLPAARAALKKAGVNLSMAISLKEWLTCSTPGEDTTVAHGQVIDFPQRFANRDGYGASNVRPVSEGPLADPDVVEGLMAGAGLIDAASALSMAKATAFRLQTPDPRFDPGQPVCVNGFLYHPATEG